MTITPGAHTASGGFTQSRAALLDRTGFAGPDRRRALAQLTEGWLVELAAEAGVDVGGVALVAVGGFGRAELSPYSDLDLVLLYEEQTPAVVAQSLAERLWYPIWDSGVRLDHSVRSLVDARQVARTDLPAALGMLDLRHIAGDPELAATLHSRVLTDWRSDAKDRLPALLASCKDRADRSGELAFATTPDVKESRGGLRDLVVMRAVAASWLADCPHQGLENARSALLDVRDAMHLVTGRAVDRLQAQDQDAVAQLLGLDDRDMLLRHVSGIGRTVVHAGDLTWHRVAHVLAGPGRGTFTDIGGRMARQAQRSPLADGIVEQDGEATLARSVNPATDPTLVLRAAAAAAQSGIPVSPATLVRLARTSRALPDPWPPAALNAFLALLGAGEPMITVWEGLDQAGLIAALIPGWERLRSLPQRDPIHLFTVDRHLMQTAIIASTLVRKVSRPDLLLLAAVFHDIGKGLPGDHSTTGAEMIGPWLGRLGLSKPDIDVVRTLIQHHLLLSESATRRDPDDPATIAVVTDAVGDAATLDLLGALTEADARAAGPAAWTSWKAGQVAYLVDRARQVLAGESLPDTDELTATERALIGAGSPGIVITKVAGGYEVVIAVPDRSGLIAAAAGVLTIHRLTIRAGSFRTIDGTGLQTWTVTPEFGEPPEASILRADLVRALDGTLDVQARLAKRSQASGSRRTAHVAPPSVRAVEGASERAVVLEVRAHDSPGLLYSIATTVAGQGATVTAARIHTVGAEVVDVFYLQSADGSVLDHAGGVEIAAAVDRALQPDCRVLR